MRTLPLLVCLLACRPDAVDPSMTPIEPFDPLPFVDPMIATGGVAAQIANVNPGASAPLGFVLVGPDSRHSTYGAPGFYHCAGYHYEDDQIDGFSHLHAHGMGVPDFGAVLVMPRAAWRDAYTNTLGRSAPFHHDTEEASAGYYAVTLDDDGTRAEITATERAAVHRYTFPDGSDPIVLFDLGHALDGVRVESSWIAVDGAEVTGFQNLHGSYSARFGGLLVHFAAEVDPAPTGSGTWVGAGAPDPEGVSAEGTRVGGWLRFPEGTTEVTLRVGVSYVDVEGARGNRVAEVDGLSFEAVRAATEEDWRAALSTVRVRGGDTSDLRTFYTAMYHAMLMPSLNVDVDGRYRGIDGEVHTADFAYYSDLSLWDTFRTLHPWYALAFPDLQRDMARSLVRMAEDGGDLPKWPLGHGYTGGMVGTPADQVLAETWLKGIDGWDVEVGFDAAWRHATGPVARAGRTAIEAYLDIGYVPVESGGGSASRTLEYAWSDHALSLWARGLGKDTEADALLAQSGNWANVWDADAGFFRGRRADGTFPPFADGQDLQWRTEYTEGNAWHYAWYVPYDVDGMIEVQHGGDRDAFVARLRTYWDNVYAEEDDIFPDDYYWHGNEPVMHYAYLAALAGDPDTTAEAARWILANRYDDTVEGLDGNDDSGTLSAWYLLSSIGVFPIAGTSTYVIGSPLWERVEIDRPDGTVVIRAPGASWDAPYVQSASIDGEPLDSVTVEHDQLVPAGELLLPLGDTPGAWRP